MPLTKVRSGGYDTIPSSVLTSVPASSLTGSSLPSTIGLGTTITTSDIRLLTGIPSTAKQVVIGVTAMSPNAAGDDANYVLQLGTSSGLVTSGYENHHWYIYGTTEGGGAASNGISLGGWGNASTHEIICHCYNVTGNIWTYNLMAQVDGGYAGGMSAVGGVNLGGSLERCGWVFTTGNYSSGTMSLTYY
jgi:hypothetical protein